MGLGLHDNAQILRMRAVGFRAPFERDTPENWFQKFLKTLRALNGKQ